MQLRNLRHNKYVKIVIKKYLKEGLNMEMKKYMYSESF